ncbi:MAG: NADH-quinone oxidoreductase subunit E [Pseudomonadota bacterium]
MSVRRLAEEDVQPSGFAFSAENDNWAKEKIKDYPEGRQASAVIPLLMRAQEQEGWVTKAAIEHVAEMLDMPLIRVLEVATFYTQFQLAPVGKRAHVQVCGTTPCMLRGAEDIMKVCKKRIAPNPFELSADGNLSWEEVECQGACVNAPMVMIFKDAYEDLTPERMDAIIDAFEKGEGSSVPTGPQIEREFSAPEGGRLSLIDEPVAKVSSGAKSAAKPMAATKPAAKNAKAAAGKSAAKPKAEKAAPAAAKLVSDAKPATKAKANTASKGAGKSAAKADSAATAGTKPEAMAKPAQPDDLKMISGIGPKIEGTLHELGVWTWAQIASWKKAERDWVNGYLSFKGRIEREDWVKQAKALAKGGRDEYVRVFGKEPR